MCILWNNLLPLIPLTFSNLLELLELEFKRERNRITKLVLSILKLELFLFLLQ